MAVPAKNNVAHLTVVVALLELRFLWLWQPLPTFNPSTCITTSSASIQPNPHPTQPVKLGNSKLDHQLNHSAYQLHLNPDATPRQSFTMLVSLTVGKVDAGVTVLLTPDKRLVEKP